MSLRFAAVAIAAFPLLVTNPATGVAQGLPPAADPPYIPTPDSVVNAMLDMARVGPGDVVFDLGSGDGRMVIQAALRGARGVGIEYEEWLVERSRSSARSAGVDSLVEFRSQDLFETDLRNASVVLMYLSADFNLRLRPRLLEQLRPGARIVSHAFHLGDWRPDASRTIGTGASRATIFRWIVPTDVDGFWILRLDGAPPVSLELNQRFQRLEGKATREDREVSVQGELTGSAISFSLTQRRDGNEQRFEFAGRVEGDRINGIVHGPGPWEGRRWVALRPTDPLLAPIGS